MVTLLEIIKLLLPGGEWLDCVAWEIDDHVVQVGRYNSDDADMFARVDKHVGFMPKEQIDDWIKRRL